MPKEANVYFKVSFYGADRETEFVVSGDCRSHIIQIPKGHGRLIDEKTLDDTIERLNTLTRYEYKIIGNILFEMPTILEAEEE